MKKEIKFKIVYGFDATEYYTISTGELLKAYYAFLNDTKIILDSGEAIRGKNIMRIEPDYNSYAGYNKGYKMRPVDYDEIPPSIQRKAKLIGSRTRSIASDLLKKSPEERRVLLSKPLPELHKQYFGNTLAENPEVKKLANSLKM